MSEEGFEFEVRPLQGAAAAVGEEVSFREEGGRLLALDEDGEAFGVVPKATAARLEALGIDSLEATVSSCEGGNPVVSLAMGDVPAEANGSVTQQPGAVPAGYGSQPGTMADGVVASAETEQAGGDSGKKKSKTKYIAIGIIVVIVVAAFVCVALFSGEKTQTVTSDWLSIEVPEDWTIEEADDDFEIYPSDYTGLVQLNAYEYEADFELQYEITDSLGAIVYDPVEVEESTIGGAVVECFEVESYEFDLGDYGTAECSGYIQYVYSGVGEYRELIILCLADEYDEHAEEMGEILNSMALENPSDPTGEDGGGESTDSSSDSSETD